MTAILAGRYLETHFSGNTFVAQVRPLAAVWRSAEAGNGVSSQLDRQLVDRIVHPGTVHYKQSAAIVEAMAPKTRMQGHGGFT